MKLYKSMMCEYKTDFNMIIDIIKRLIRQIMKKETVIQ